MSARVLSALWFTITHPRRVYRIAAWETLRQSVTMRPTSIDPLVDMFHRGVEYPIYDQQWIDLYGKPVPIIRLALHAR